MKLKFKKEVVNSVVYETDEPKAPIRSVYVSKDWLTEQGHNFEEPIYLVVEVEDFLVSPHGN